MWQPWRIRCSLSGYGASFADMWQSLGTCCSLSGYEATSRDTEENVDRLVQSYRAGIASGIDMALALVERHHGPRVTAAAARELVVYLRRDGSHQQHSFYLDYRTHLHPGVHRVQDWLIANPAERSTLADLARL